LSSTS